MLLELFVRANYIHNGTDESAIIFSGKKMFHEVKLSAI